VFCALQHRPSVRRGLADGVGGLLIKNGGRPRSQAGKTFLGEYV
jgi:hypothetical protein